MNKNILRAFIVSSSLPAFFITALYLGYGVSNSKSRYLPTTHYQWFMLIVPLLYGIFGSINYALIKYNSNTSLVVGAALGIVLSVIGRQLDLPQKLFGFTSRDEYLVHIYAAILYALIFFFIVNPLISFTIHNY